MKAFQLLILFAALAIASSLHADLVGVDLHASGDQLLTLDSSSGLEWLDISLTLNSSSTQVRDFTAAPGTFSDFRIATVEEFDALLSHAGVSFTGSVSSDDSVGILKVAGLQALLGTVQKPIIPGPPFPPLGTGYYTLGYLQSGSPGIFAFGRVIIYDFDAAPERYDVSDATFGPAPIVDAAIGYYLVRSVPVPEPGSYSLLTGAALLVICFVRRLCSKPSREKLQW